MGYSREEMETCIIYNNVDDEWEVYSSVPKHIRKLEKIANVQVLESENDRPIAVKCVLGGNMVSMKKKREMSDEQRKLAAERLKKARANK